MLTFVVVSLRFLQRFNWAGYGQQCISPCGMTIIILICTAFERSLLRWKYFCILPSKSNDDERIQLCWGNESNQVKGLS